MEKQFENDFSKRLYESHKKKGLTQKAAAYQVGIGLTTLQGHEYGTTYPTANILAKYAKTYGVSADYLLFGNQIVTDNFERLMAELRINDPKKKCIRAQYDEVIKALFDLIKEMR
ncbi:MAG: helix-turn-helix domain-containing protein [Bacteroides thetaiotaomicron]|nr:helix-turn-helix domain-containing protein [Bacteroides thetaiotaomicron]